jgi:hypothetical protein
MTFRCVYYTYNLDIIGKFCGREYNAFECSFDEYFPTRLNAVKGIMAFLVDVAIFVIMSLLKRKTSKALYA